MRRSIWKQLEHWKNKPNRKPLILKGARQVGKTYILKAFGEALFDGVHYLNFEKQERLSALFSGDLDPREILKNLSFHLDADIRENDLLIFDEIQNTPRALNSLKYFQEEMPQLHLCAAGSLLGLQLCDSSFPVGKVEFLNIYPMSFREFLSATGEKRSYNILAEFDDEKLDGKKPLPPLIHEHLWQQLKLYFVVGGLPEVVKLYASLKEKPFLSLKEARKLQEDLINAYLADMAKHSGKQNSMHLERLWRNIPSQLARELNGSTPKFTFKDIIPGLRRYSQLAGALDWLKTASLIIQVQIANRGLLPFSAYTAQNLFKAYLFDVGLLGALSDLPPKTILDYDYGSYKGYFAENFVAQEISCATSKPLHSWKESRSEVEFLLEIDGEIVPVEVKSGRATKARSLKAFVEKYSSKLGIIMSAENIEIGTHTHRYPLYLAEKIPQILDYQIHHRD